ncbi:MAG TPA: hypothetical protein VMG34_14565, partial [Bacteroidota bacterium]|nr:hypothetical protein [Bacteroidota bacterium]
MPNHPRMRLRRYIFIIPLLLIFRPPAMADVRPTPALTGALRDLLAAFEDHDTDKLKLLTTNQGYKTIVRALNSNRQASRMLKEMGTGYAASRV